MYSVKEGDLYKIVTIFGESFELRYGYYEDYERESGEPLPIYPDLRISPRYAPDGRPFVTQMQEPCEYADCRIDDDCCASCRYYRDCEELIGVCDHPDNRLR